MNITVLFLIYIIISFLSEFSTSILLDRIKL